MRTRRLILMIAMVILMASSLAGCMGGCDRTLKPYSVSGRVVTQMESGYAESP